MNTIERLRIEVTQTDIDDGEPLEQDACPVSLAVDRVLGKLADTNYWETKTCGVSVHVDFEPDKAISHRNFVFTLPKYVRQWIQDFDNGEPVEPLVFDIEQSDVGCG